MNDELWAMTPEQQRITIAIACGWCGFNPDKIPYCLQYTAKAPSGKWGLIPDYLNDLNAIHEAWCLLPTLPMVGREVSNEKIALRQLAMVVAPKYAPDWPNCDSYSIRAVLAIANATAAQRAEAFLRTIGKWVSE